MDESNASDRNRDLESIRSTYRRYEIDGRSRLWDPENPGYARMMHDRDSALIDLIRRSVVGSESRVLDLGAGDGRLADLVRDAGVPTGRWVGVDLDPQAVASAAAAIPWGEFIEASADRLPFKDEAFDVVVTTTLFSSLPSPELESDVAAEVRRVLAPGGWLIWYDLRYGNPSNPSVHGIDRSSLSKLFTDWVPELRSLTLLPPIARRLGPTTGAVYGLLEHLPILRSHLIGRLHRP